MRRCKTWEGYFFNRNLLTKTLWMRTHTSLSVLLLGPCGHGPNPLPQPAGWLRVVPEVRQGLRHWLITATALRKVARSRVGLCPSRTHLLEHPATCRTLSSNWENQRSRYGMCVEAQQLRMPNPRGPCTRI